MTDPAATPTTPAGWYPDPYGGVQRRWWDGTQWSEHLEQPVAPAELTAPAGVSTNTTWIWLIVFLPLLSYIPLFLIDWRGYLEDSMTLSTSATASLGLLTDPWYVVSLLMNFVLGGLLLLFAALDHRVLVARGVPRPFHWAWMAFCFVGAVNLVYIIGRAVVTKRRTGGGRAPLWATIGVIALGFVIVIVFMVWLVSMITEMVASTSFI